MNRKILLLAVIVVSILICVFNILSGTLDNFFWRTQYTLILFIIDTMLILYLLFARRRK